MRFNTCNYSVELDLQSASCGLHQEQIAKLDRRLEQIRRRYPYFADICRLRDGILRYESQTLLPKRVAPGSRTVLIVLGNPAIHSVWRGMFCYCRRDGGRHDFWGRLAGAGIVETIHGESREAEARARLKLFESGRTSASWVVGLTTFYSFPTPGADTDLHGGAAGVESLFEPMLKHLCRQESRRILGYPFADGAILVFTQKSTLRRFYANTGIRPCYWPIRGEDSSGDALAGILATARKTELRQKALLFA